MPVLYVVWVGGPLEIADLQEYLHTMDVTTAQCALLADHFAAELRFDCNEDRRKVLMRRYMTVGRRLLVVSEEHPLPEAAPPLGSPKSPDSSLFVEIPSLHDLDEVRAYSFPAGPVNAPERDSPTISAPQTPCHVISPRHATFSELDTPTALLLPAAMKRRMTYSLYQKTKSNIYKVCLTGGPCAGKTTVLSTIITKFAAQGIRTYAVPEVATILITGGMSFSDMTPEKAVAYQSIVLSMQLSIEQHFLDIAIADKRPALIISDRGTMDGKAYCDEDTWTQILREQQVSNVQLRDQQYDAVYHLVTAADGAESFYNCENNAARQETPQEARDLDTRTLSAYLGHPHLRIIDNSTDFARKVERVLKSISEGMGVSLPSGVHRRYLVETPAPSKLPVPTVTLDVEIGILLQPDLREDVEVRVLSRGQDGRFSYSLQELRDVNGQPVITEKKLTHHEYLDRRKLLDKDLEIIRKRSLSFTYQNQYFELGTIVTPELYAGTVLLHIESDDEPVLPPFIPVVKEVTADPHYSNMAISQNDYGPMDTGLPRVFSTVSFDTDDYPSEEANKDPDQLMPARTASVLPMRQSFSLKRRKSKPIRRLSVAQAVAQPAWPGQPPGGPRPLHAGGHFQRSHMLEDPGGPLGPGYR